MRVKFLFLCIWLLAGSCLGGTLSAYWQNFMATTVPISAFTGVLCGALLGLLFGLALLVCHEAIKTGTARFWALFLSHGSD